MPRLLCAAALLVLAAASLACSSGSPAVRLATEGAYPPYNFLNADGEVDGFERELGDALCRRADLQCIWVTDAWEGMIANLVAGAYDALLTGVRITAEREALIDFTQPYLPSSPSVYVARAGADDAVTGGTVAAQVGTVQAGYLAQSNATLVEYALVPEAVAAVLRGEAEAALIDLGVGLDALAGSGGQLTLVGPAVRLGAGVGVGVRESDGWLRDRLDWAIASMKDDGSLNALITKWFGPAAPTF